MKNYELLCILPGTMTEEEVGPVLKEVEDILNNQGAQNIKLEDMGKNRLSYPMNNIRYGYFRLFTFESEKQNINKIQERLNMMTTLLRALISEFDPSKRKSSKITYVTDSSGVVTMTKDTIAAKRKNDQVKDKVEKNDTEDKTEDKKEKPGITKEADNKKQQKTKKGKKVDLKDIDKELDKILESDISGV
ncbi:MAG: 30S ribosomal protein S6 [Candidatus Magasanikbacteria bacterium]|nr:30S ribosomal protein S6 [Candidatus Magasanikbacteria bacterium]